MGDRWFLARIALLASVPLCPRPGLLARALETPVLEVCSLPRADGVSRALSGPWVLAALCVVPSELARAVFEESGEVRVPEQSNVTVAPLVDALT